MLSVAIIAKNESRYLVKCINSVRSLVDDIIVVVDSLSTDNTYLLANKFADTVAVHPFVDFADQKNFALSLTRHSWVLALDADEVVTTALAYEILTTLRNPTFKAYRIPRTNIIFGKIINHSNWSAKQHAQVRLFNKHHCRWKGEVHEQVQVQGQVGQLLSASLHYNYDSVEEFIVQLNQYTTLESLNRRLHLFHIMVYPFWKFFRHYILYLGFLDGWHGLFLAYLMAVYGTVISLKICLRSS